MKRLALILSLMLMSCAPSHMISMLDAEKDPMYDFSKIKTIALIPRCWTGWSGPDCRELFEKQLLYAFGQELAARNIRTIFIDKKDLSKSDSANGTIRLIGDNEPVEAMLYVEYHFLGGTTARFSEPAQGGAVWSPYGGAAYYNADPGFYVTSPYRYQINCSIMGENGRVWEGCIEMASREDDLATYSQQMVKQLLDSKLR